MRRGGAHAVGVDVTQFSATEVRDRHVDDADAVDQLATLAERLKFAR